MKKTLIAIAAVGTMLFTACSNEEIVTPAGGDGTVTFTFVPEGALSRAYSDGLTATTLHYAAYEAGTGTVIYTSNVADDPKAVKAGDRNFTLTLNLVKGKSYDFVFWADKGEGSPYTFDEKTQSVSVAYDAPVAGNDEGRDAFFQTVKNFKVNGPAQESVTLRRPFAQINIGTSDLAEAAMLNTVVASTSLKAKGVHNALNLYTGIASGEADVEFTATGVPQGETFPNVKEGVTYDYLSMNYVLTGVELEGDDVQKAKSELLDCVFTMNYEGGKSQVITLNNVPVQRNYRTNIFGALITSPLDFTIIVDQDFYDPDKDTEVVAPGKVVVDGKNYDSLDEALAAATTATPALKLGAGEYTLPATLVAEGRTGLSIEGSNGVKIVYPGVNDVPATGMDVAFKNVTFSTPQTSSYSGFVGAKSETYDNVDFVDGSLYPMAQQVVITNSNFTVNPQADSESPAKYALRFQNRKSIPAPLTTAVISNTTFTTHLSTAVTAYNSKTDLTFENCTFINKDVARSDANKDAQSAIAYSNAQKGGEFEHTLTINNCRESGFIGHFLSDSKLWACKTGEMKSVTIDGAEITQAIVNPNGTKTYKLYTPSALVVISKLINEGYWKDGVKKIDRLSGYTLELANDIDMSGVAFTPIGVNINSYPSKHFAGTFDGKGHTISNLTASDNTPNYAAAGLFGGLVGSVKNVTLKDVNVTSTHYAGGIAGYCDNNTGVVIDNCKVIGGTITSTTEQVGGSWDNGDKAGGILGYGCNYSDKVANCTVENVTIKCYRHGGPIVGYAGQVANVTGNTAKNVTLLWDGTNDYKSFGSVANAPFGLTVGNQKELVAGNTAEGVNLPQ